MLLKESLLSKIINTGLSQGADFCEVYVEETSSYQMELKDSKVLYLSGRDKGIGIRLLFNNEELYTYTNNFNEDNLIRAVKNLSLLKKASSQKSLSNENHLIQSSAYEFPEQNQDFNLESKKKMLQKLDRDIRAYHSSITQAVFSLMGTEKKVQVANSEGLLSFDFRPYHFIRMMPIAEDQGQKESGYVSKGLSGADTFFSEDMLREASLESGQQAIQNLHADEAPAGAFPVIINNGFGGVIFHEACGHGLETTSVADNQSIFSDKLGKKIAESCVTAYDDGTLKNEYGFLNTDDEGEPAQKTKLIDQGILKSYMVDRLGSQKTNYKKTGSARRQNYKYPPTSRMRNTFIANGESSLESMIKDVPFGLFAESLGGGSVTPGTGNYNFAVTSARLIKNGKLDKAVKGASLIGNGLDTLSKIKKVGTNLKLSPGHCGSVSGWVPVTVGQPPILVSELTVGGQSQKDSSGSFK